MIPSRRARIALVVDVPNGSFDALARTISAALAERFDVEILYLSDYEPDSSTTTSPGSVSELFHELFCGAYDLVHAFSASFEARVFDPVIAAEPLLRDPNAVVDRLLRVPLSLGDSFDATRAGAGPISEAAVWERSKAWSARVDRVLAAGVRS